MFVEERSGASFCVSSYKFKITIWHPSKDLKYTFLYSKRESWSLTMNSQHEVKIWEKLEHPG